MKKNNTSGPKLLGHVFFAFARQGSRIPHIQRPILANTAPCCRHERATGVAAGLQLHGAHVYTVHRARAAYTAYALYGQSRAEVTLEEKVEDS